jgi:hypothetical protein
MRRSAYRLSLSAISALASLAYLAVSAAPAQAASRSCGARAIFDSSSSAAQDASNAARIALSIDHGASGTAVSVTGTAWPANMPITVDFVDTGDQNLGREGIAQAQSDATGAFRSPEFLAPTAHCGVSPGAGTVSLVVAHTGDGAIKAQARFTFVASPALSTNLPLDLLMVRSTHVPITGRSWGAGTLVTLYATQEQEVDHVYSFVRMPGAPSVEVRADATGAFQATVPLPTGFLPAIHISVAATATSLRYGSLTRNLSNMFLVTPDVYPSVALSAEGVARGGVLTITGDHWRRGDTVSVETCLDLPEPNRQSILGCPLGRPPTLLAKITIGDDGRFVVKALIPRQAHLGATVVRIYANDASLQWYDETLAVKILDAPANESVPFLGAVASSPGMSALAVGALLLGGLGAGYVVRRRRRSAASAISGSFGDVIPSGGDDDERSAS